VIHRSRSLKYSLFMQITHDLVGTDPGQYNNPYALVWVSYPKL